MITEEQQKEIREKLVQGLKRSYDRLLKSKRESKSEIVIIRNNKIVRIKP
jgi:hypothetical protein